MRHLATFATSIIGRERELASLTALVAGGERLVTILGPAGVGKTRLALHFAERVAHERPLIFCDLVGVKTVESACRALSGVLEVPLAASDPTKAVDQLGRVLAGRGSAIVVLDNFEELVASGGDVVATWHQAAPEALFVVTSREKLRLAAECCFELSPLEVPDARETNPERIAETGAVRLFVARASLARAGFRLAPHQAPTAAAIVRALDGMPLAIELCAVRASMLGVEQLLGLMPRQLDTLGQGPRNSSARHTTLRRAIDASWQGLSSAEQDALAACSVFRGGWSLEAAERVIGSGALDLMQALHDKSLVRTYEPASGVGELRNGLYESIRAYAAERLIDSGRVEHVQSAHAAYFLATYGGREPQALELGEVQFHRHLLLDSGNLEAIYERASNAEPRTARTVATTIEALLALLPVYLTRGPLDRYLSRASKALGHVEDRPIEPELHGRARAFFGWMLFFGGQRLEARRELTRAVEIALSAGDFATRVFALGKLAMVESVLCNWQASQARLDEAMGQLSTVGGSARVRADLLRDRAHALGRLGRCVEAIDDLEEALSLAREAGALRDEATVLSALAETMLEIGELEKAVAHCEKMRAVAREVGDRRREAFASILAGIVAKEELALERARLSFGEALKSGLERGDCWMEALAHQHLGDVDLLAERWDEARSHHARAESLFRSTGDLHYATICLAATGVAAAHLGEGDAASLFHQADELASATVTSGAEAISLFRGHLDVIVARQARANGDEAEAHARLEQLRESLARESTGNPRRARPDELRFARRLLEQQLEKIPTRFVVVEPKGAWFDLGAGRVELGRRSALRNLLCALVRQHSAVPGGPLTLDELFRVGWPGEKAPGHAARNRTKVALTALRNMGLRDVLQTHEGGYRLAPTVGVSIATALPKV